MKNYGWNIDDLKTKAYTVLNNVKDITDPMEKERLYDLYEEYVRLINIALMHDDDLVEERIPSGVWLSEIRTDEALDDYDKRTKEIRKRILSSFKGFSKTPSPKFSKTFEQEYLIYLLGDIIHEIFGDDNYQVYKERIIEAPSMLQLSRVDGDALTSLFVRGEELDIYTAVPDVKNIGFIANLAHESGHTYRFVTNEYLVFPENKLKEFESFSYEIRVLDFMIRNNIYGREALKAMIKLFNKIETIMYMLKNMDLSRAKHLQHLTHMAHSRDLYSLTHLPNNYELLRYLEYVKCEYVFPYIYSALAVFDTLESDKDLSGYRGVINSIGVVDEDEIASTIVDNPINFNHLSNYRKYRNKILGLYNEQIS